MTTTPVIIVMIILIGGLMLTSSLGFSTIRANAQIGNWTVTENTQLTFSEYGTQLTISISSSDSGQSSFTVDSSDQISGSGTYSGTME